MRNLTCSAKSLEHKMDALHFLLASVGLLFHILPTLCNAADSIRPPLFLSEGQTLVSEGGRFELGFFSPGDSRLRYVGIWYKTIPIRTVVWVANRENPIQDSRGLLMINSTRGSLQIHSGNHCLLWSSNSTKGIQNPVAQLLDSGNFVLRDEKEVPASVLWQSFDHPSDTLLPEMKLGWDSRTRFNRRLSSWKSSNDPSPGELTYGVELHSYPECVMWKGSNKFYRTCPWTGLWFSGLPELRPDPVYRFEFHMNKDEVYYSFQLKNKSEISRWVLNGTASPSGQRYIWVEAEKAWNLSHSLPRDSCDTYGLCGRNGICITTESHSCECLKGFEPKSRERWNEMDWSHGCVRSKALNFSNPNGFVKFDGLKLPDTTHTWVNTSMSLKECMVECLANGSCSAFANSDVRNGGSGCAIWFGDLIDIRQLPAGGQELYVRMPASELGANNPAKRRTVVIVVAAAGIFCGMLFAYYCIRRNWNNLRGNDKGKYNNSEELEGDLELPLFDLATIVNATGNFSGNNKLGEGGFGPVYKGTLRDGQEIAVKKLSFSSEQGSNEFENEVTLIAKLQHRNLVKLLGCCIAGEDKMLIYEYMPNKSLDFFIFDPEKANMLDWSKRFKIICGIARGLLYLHQDSRLRIIHRDLKASNILLDSEMNPKISDFGLARSFENEHDTMANTNRVVGTYGYMAPEYAIDGLFSIKSDVFSFGILLLEIVSGKKNRVFFHRSRGLNLSGHVWKLWKEGRCLELVDASYEDSNSASEIVRCICIGLLCVQEQPEDRPDMASVILMLTSESLLVQPEQPGFFVDRDPSEHGESSSSRNKSRSASETAASLLGAGYFLANADNSRDKPHLVWPFFRKSLCGTTTPCPRSHLNPI